MILSDKDYALVHERLRKAEKADDGTDQDDLLYWLDMSKQYIQIMIEKVAMEK